MAHALDVVGTKAESYAAHKPMETSMFRALTAMGLGAHDMGVDKVAVQQRAAGGRAGQSMATRWRELE